MSPRVSFSEFPVICIEGIPGWMMIARDERTGGVQIATASGVRYLSGEDVARIWREIARSDPPGVKVERPSQEPEAPIDG